VADRRLALAGALLIGLGAGFAWLSRHPETPWLDRAASWPVVGGLAGRFRAAWRAPPPPTAPEPGGVEVITIWLPPLPPAGVAAPGPVAAAAARPVPDAAPAAPVDRSAEPVLPLPARRADAERLARVATLLGPEARASSIGPYGFLGDLEPPARWSSVAGALDAAFAERTGLAPLGEPAETVVAVAAPATYRELARLEPRLAGLDAGGHAAAGLAVVLAEPEAPEAAEATLIHELAHCVIRRAVGPALPPWLDEGLAEDLAWTPFDPRSARFRLGELAGSVRREGPRVEIAGAWAALERLVAAHAGGRLPPVARLVELDWEGFVAGDDAALRYAEAFLFVRFLLDGGEPALAGAFRTFLARVAAGGATDRAALEAALGADLEALEPAFRAWVALRKATAVDAAVAALARPGERVVPAGPRPP
jgi:hypothetical protein